MASQLQGLPTGPAQNPIANLVYCVTLADPNLQDCPLIGCSDGFEVLSGYRRSEVLGRNCRFLTQGCPINANLSLAIRHSICNGDEFLGVLLNRRKSGEQFQCLLHLLSIFVGGKRYVVGVQADASNICVNLGDPNQVAFLRQVHNSILAASIEAWVPKQVSEFAKMFPGPMRPVEEAEEASHEGYDLPQNESAYPMHEKNTFLHFDDGASEDLGEPQFMRRCTSESQLVFKAGRTENQPAQELAAEEHYAEHYAENYTSSLAPTSPGRETEGGELFEAPSLEQKSMPSAGSTGHPDKCTECQFHFFSSSGCRMGADCRFCHRFHPRKCQKKNRKILKRLELSKPEKEQLPVPLVPGRGTFAGGSEDVPIIQSLHYLKEAYTDKARPPRATFMVGQKFRLAPIIKLGISKSQALMNFLVFSVEPALPEGVTLHAGTGVISGCAMKATARDLYTITVGAPATAPSGLQLGSLPLCKCCISLRVTESKLASYDRPAQSAAADRPSAVGHQAEARAESKEMPHDIGGSAFDRRAGG